MYQRAHPVLLCAQSPPPRTLLEVLGEGPYCAGVRLHVLVQSAEDVAKVPEVVAYDHILGAFLLPGGDVHHVKDARPVVARALLLLRPGHGDKQGESERLQPGLSGAQEILSINRAHRFVHSNQGRS